MAYVFVALLVAVVVVNVVLYFLPQKPPLRALPPDVFTRSNANRIACTWRRHGDGAPCTLENGHDGRHSYCGEMDGLWYCERCLVRRR